MFIIILSFLGTLSSIFFLKPLANKFNILDKPSERKCHEGNVPLIGGFAILIGIYLSVFQEMINDKIYSAYLVSAFLVFVLGFVDDCKPLSVKIRIIIQFLVISIMIFYTDLKFDTFGHSFGLEEQIGLGYFAYPITILGVLFVTNAFNLMDGSDGIVGFLAFLVLIGINFFGFNSNILSIAMAGSLIPYLWFNLSQSTNKKIFLGDGGSLLIGYSIAFLLLYETQVEKSISPPFALWLIAIPIFDALSVLIYRLKNKSPLLAPDRNHIHHYLQSFDLNSAKILLSIIVFGFLILLLALFLEYKLKLLSFPIFLISLFSYIFFRVFSKYSTHKSS